MVAVDWVNRVAIERVRFGFINLSSAHFSIHRPSDTSRVGFPTQTASPLKPVASAVSNFNILVGRYNGTLTVKPSLLPIEFWFDLCAMQQPVLLS